MPIFKNMKNHKLIKKSYSFIFFRIILIICIIPNLSALDIPFHTKNELDEFALKEEPLETEELLRLFLLSSGTDPSKYVFYEESFHTQKKDLESFIQQMDRQDRSLPPGDLILQFMHKDILTRYNENQTRLGVLMDTGVYNCVSSAVYYMLLCRAAGLEVKGIHAVDHAFCAVKEPGLENPVDVETTNQWGYNPGTKKAFESDFTERTGFIYVPPGKYADRFELGDKGMAGLILQNRIVEHQRKGEYHIALELASDRLVLTGSEGARKDYFDSIQNLAAMYNQQKDYEKAIDLINESENGPYQLPNFLNETRYQVIYNLCSTILNAGDTDQAEKILKSYSSYLPGEILNELTFLIEERRLDRLIRQGYSSEIVQRIINSQNQGILTSKRAEEMLIYLYAREAEKISLEKDYLSSLRFLDTVPPVLKDNRDFLRLKSVYENNYAVAVHNSIIPLLEKGEKGKAEKIISEALILIPGNQILMRDLKRLESF